MHTSKKVSLLILAALLLLAAPLSTVRAQSVEPPSQALPGPRVITIADETESGFRQDAPAWVLQAMQAAAEQSFAAGEGESALGAGFRVEYVAPGSWDYSESYFCDAFPAPAQAAMEYAASIWSTLLNPRVPVVIQACWAVGMPERVLGSSGSAYVWGIPTPNTPFPYMYYTDPLANELEGTDQHPAPDIVIAFSNAVALEFDYSLKGPVGSNRFHFTTLALHEIAHGLGMAGSLRRDSSGQVSRSAYLEQPMIYDLFTTNASGQFLYTLAGYPGPSTNLTSAVTGQVYFKGQKAVAANGGQPVPIFSPDSFQTGSSYTHLDEGFNNTPNALMTYALAYREVNLDPGPVTLGILADIGWQVVIAPQFQLSLTPGSVVENLPVGTLVGALASTPPDAGLTFSLPAGKGNNNQFAIQDGKLVTKAVFDFEATPTRAVVVASSDENGPLGEKTFTIAIVDANDPVTGLSSSRAMVQKNWPAGKLVAGLIALDQDRIDTHSFTLLPATSDDPEAVVYPDNANFRVADGALFLQQPLPDDIPLGSKLTLGVRAQDRAGTSFAGPLELTVVALVPEQVFLPMTIRPASAP